MRFTIIGEIINIEPIAVGSSIREIGRLRKVYGAGRWRKLKGTASIQFTDGTITNAELHRYEAHGQGRKEIKIKRMIRQP
jgi:hypothetical protein